LAADLADAAGAAIRPYFRRRLAIDDKPDLSPVTVADREAEMAMRRLITARFPDHGIIGEEFGREREDAEFVWVLDPIDGTKSFISGVPLFGTLIALARGGRRILGIIDQPISR
jgi:inositol-phosphate phosphatase/L-galactose 1-phosphate phosphatase/histidinol-phosphatase